MSLYEKVSVREQIPPRLAAIMKDLSARIDAGDYETTHVSDDLLQWDCCFGGLCEPEKQMFGFAFVPIDDDDDAEFPVEWNLYFSREQIRAIADRKLTEIEMWRCQTDCGGRYWTARSYCTKCDTDC